MEENWMVYILIFQKKLKNATTKLTELFGLSPNFDQIIKLLWKNYLLAWNQAKRPIISKFTIPTPGHYSSIKKGIHKSKTSINDVKKKILL
jgi:hypothetical protein